VYVCMCVCVGWICGGVDVWMCGYVDLWLAGCVGV
jgi:hypothetical protein